VFSSLVLAFQSELKPFFFVCKFTFKILYFALPLLLDQYKLVAFLNEFFDELILLIKLEQLIVAFYLQATGQTLVLVVMWLKLWVRLLKLAVFLIKLCVKEFCFGFFKL